MYNLYIVSIISTMISAIIIYKIYGLIVSRIAKICKSVHHC